jgi:hypothetical protein
VGVTEKRKLIELFVDQFSELDEDIDKKEPLVTVKDDPGETATVVPLFDTFNLSFANVAPDTVVSKSQALK